MSDHDTVIRPTGSVSRRNLLRATLLGAGTAVIGAPAKTAATANHQDDATPYFDRQRQERDLTLTIAAFASPVQLDPHAAYEYQSTLAILGAYEGLICLKDAQTDQYEGLIAESWEAPDDKSVWTFHLRDGVTFHDGSPLDANAVRASFERFLALGYPPSGIIRRFFTDANQIAIPDARTVVFNLQKPQPLFAAALASTYGTEIVNAARLRQHDVDGDWGHAWAELNEDGCGSGPYRVVDFRPGQSLEMERNADYWRGWSSDHFDRIVIRTVPEEATRRELIERGDVDIVDNLTPESIDALTTHPDLVVDEHTSTQVQYFIMSIAGPLAEVEARQALCQAFPYSDVVDGVYNGHAERAIGAVAAATRGFAPTTPYYSTDLATARDLLADAEVPTGTTLRIAVPTGDVKIITTAELFRENLTGLGFDVQVEANSLEDQIALLFGEQPVEDRPNLIWWGWWPDYNDAWDHLDPQVSCDAQSPNGGNAGFYCNPAVDGLLDRARDATTTEEYDRALATVQQIVSVDDPPAIYYLQPHWTTVLRNDVTGFVFNPINIGTYNFWNLRRGR